MSRWFISIGIFIELTSIILTIYSAIAVHDAAKEKQRTTFERRIDRGMEAALDRLRSYEHVLIAGAGFFNGSSDVSRSEWKAFTDSLNIDQNFPGISGFGFIRHIPQDEIDSFLASARENSAPDFSIKTLGDIPKGPRYIIDYIQPIHLNLEAQGLDIGSNHLRRRSADNAMLSGSTSITDMIQLVQDHENNPGFLMLYPVYQGGVVPNKKERPEKIIGWTYAPFVGKKIMKGVSSAAGPSISFDIYDEDISENNRIYQGIEEHTQGTFSTRSTTICDQTWIFKWRDEHGTSLSTYFHDDSWWVLASGLFTSSGLLLVMLLLHRNNHRAMKLLNEAMKEKDIFVSTMSHEIRTPLHGVIGMSESLHDSPELSEETQDQVNDLRTSAETLYALINNILDFSKIQKGKMPLESIPFQPSQILLDIHHIFKHLMDDRNVTLSIHADDKLWVEGDPIRLKQILVNLVGNSVKFTEEGQISIHASYENQGLTLIVKDTGIGMKPQYLAKLFLAFTQEDDSFSRKYGGTGLGMTISKGLIDAMEGTIEVDSAPQKGSTFKIWLPLKKVEASKAPLEVSTFLESLKMRVLMAEDNPINIKLGVKVLEKLGCNVVVAKNGQLAVDILKNDSAFDLILMDLSMPVMDGFEASKCIRQMGIKTRIVAFSANVEKRDHQKAKDCGMDGFIPKPILKQHLYEELSKAKSSS